MNAIHPCFKISASENNLRDQVESLWSDIVFLPHAFPLSVQIDGESQWEHIRGWVLLEAKDWVIVEFQFLWPIITLLGFWVGVFLLHYAVNSLRVTSSKSIFNISLADSVSSFRIKDFSGLGHFSRATSNVQANGLSLKYIRTNV